MTHRNSKALACSAVAVFLTLAATPGVSRAEEDANAAVTAETDRLKAQTERINAEAARINAQAARTQARIDALGLPSFEGTAEAGERAGGIEAAMLSTAAVQEAAAQLAPRLRDGTYVLLAGDEALDFGAVGAILTQMDAIKSMFDRAPDASGRPRAPVAGDPTAIIGAITAAAGLLRSDVELTALPTESVSHEMLVTALAARLGERAVLPSAMIGVVQPCMPMIPNPGANPTPAPPGSCLPPSTGNWEEMYLLHRFNRLVERRQEAAAARSEIPAATRNPALQRRAAALDAAIARFDAFYTSVTSPDDNGAVPLAVAARLDMLRRSSPRIARIHVAQSGGSLVNRRNLATTLALADPLRVSGALIVRYVVTDPVRGTPYDAGILTCQTTLTSLRRIQNWSWTGAGGEGRARCR